MGEITYFPAPKEDWVVEALAGLLAQAHSEYAYDIGKPNIEKGKKWVRGVLQNGIVFLALLEGVVVGSIGMDVQEWPASDGVFLTDQWLFVAPEQRSSGVGMKLLEMAKDVASATKTPLLLVHSIGVDVKLKERFFKSQGFVPVGGLYRYGID